MHFMCHYCEVRCRNIKQLGHGSNVHRRRQGELDHEHVAVERVVGQEPDSVRGMDHGDADQRQDHEAYADDRDDHRALEPRLPKPLRQVST